MRQYIHSLMTDQRRGPLSGLVKLFLWVLSLIYRMLLKGESLLRKIGLLRTERLPLAVISVGNLTVGGTGKTPFVHWLVQRLLSRQKKVAVLTHPYFPVNNGLSDEALELKRRLPQATVWAGKNRVLLSQKAVLSRMDAVILDDGFQYRKLHRDLDIVLIDATNPFGNGKTLPRGILREEPVSLRRADLLVLTRTDDTEPATLHHLEEMLSRLAPGIPLLFSVHRPKGFIDARTQEPLSLENLRKKRGIAFCGIGSPGSFFRALGKCGIEPLRTVSFSDHHPYRRRDLERLDRLNGSLGGEVLFTTAKDVERLQAFGLWPKSPLAVLEVELVVTQHEDKLLQRLNTLSVR